MWYYFVHYNGWNKKYDTWVEDAGLIKMPQDDAGPPVRLHGINERIRACMQADRQTDRWAG